MGFVTEGGRPTNSRKKKLRKRGFREWGNGEHLTQKTNGGKREEKKEQERRKKGNSQRPFLFEQP